MSVPTYERKESKIEFLDKAIQLHKFVASILCERFSKKFTFYGINKTYEYAAKIAEDCIKANSYDLYTYYNERTFLFNDAIATLNCLSIQLSLIKEYSNKVTEKQWVKLGVDIANLRNYLKAIIKSDKERFDKKK